MSFAKQRRLEDPAQQKQNAKALWRLFGYIMWVSVISAVMCAFNTALVYALIRGLEPVVAGYGWGQPTLKYSMAILPALLVFAQWHTWDLLSQRRLR